MKIDNLLKKTNIELSLEEATAFLTRLEYYLLYDLEQKEKYQNGLLQYYEPISEGMIHSLNELLSKLLPLVFPVPVNNRTLPRFTFLLSMTISKDLPSEPNLLQKDMAQQS